MVQPSDYRVHYKSPMQGRDKSTVMSRKLDRNIAHQHTTFVLRKTKLLYCGRKWACGPRGHCGYTATFEFGMNRRTSISGRSRPHDGKLSLQFEASAGETTSRMFEAFSG